jgi:hypothetical protein
MGHTEQVSVHTSLNHMPAQVGCDRENIALFYICFGLTLEMLAMIELPQSHQVAPMSLDETCCLWQVSKVIIIVNFPPLLLQFYKACST